MLHPETSHTLQYPGKDDYKQVFTAFDKFFKKSTGKP